jgi:hypothetical protein
MSLRPISREVQKTLTLELGLRARSELTAEYVMSKDEDRFSGLVRSRLIDAVVEAARS